MELNYEIKYADPKHGKILTKLDRLIDMAKRAMVDRNKAWEDTEKLFKAYVKDTSENLARKSRKSQGQQQYVDLVIPYSYAMLLSAHTYWTSVFLTRSPVLQFSGRHGEAEMKVQALEAVMDYQTQVGEHLVPYYIWLLDAGKYGFGVIGEYWAEEQETVATIEEVEESKTLFGLAVPGTKTTKKQKRVRTLRGYSGNRVFNVRPQDFYPDPRVSLINYQKGEFCGRAIAALSWNEVLKGKDDGRYYNVESLSNIRTSLSDRTTTFDNLPDISEYLNTVDGKGKGFSSGYEIVVELVPRDWDLGTQSSPEKWVFTVADKVIIASHPLGAIHNKYPFSLMMYEIEGYSTDARGVMEIAKPLNDTISWLVNSHFYNVRASLNGIWSVDPSMVNMKDFEAEGPGRILRLRPEAYGRDVRTALQQYPVDQATNNHLSETSLMAEFLQRALGITDNVMGMLNKGGRKTATEVRTSSSFGINRLKTFAEYNSSLGFAPMSQRMVQNTQQYYDEAKTFKLAGDLMRPGMKFVQVNPEDILGFFDFVPVDGTLPVDRFAQATLWKELLMGMVKMPQLAQQFDLVGIFSWMAQLGGLKNIDEFKIKVVPDQQIGPGSGLVPAGEVAGSSTQVGGGQTAAGMAGLPQMMQ